MAKITARVPATAANLGPGFDCLGIAVGLYADITMETDTGRAGMECTGEGYEILPTGRSNLVRRAIARYFEVTGRTAPPHWLHMHNRIPVTGGLGGSAAAIVGGLLLANELCGNLLTRAELLELATEIEGHPDNVAPALEGGMVVATMDQGKVYSIKVPVPPSLRAVVFVPEFAMPTAEARRILPKMVHRRQAIFNIGRAATLVAAMYSGRLDLLRVATQDQLHQPYREQMFPAMPRFFKAGLDAGALGAYLCGAGSSLMALVDNGEQRVVEAFRRVSEEAEVPGRVATLAICENGAEVWQESAGQVPPRPHCELAELEAITA